MDKFVTLPPLPIDGELLDESDLVDVTCFYWLIILATFHQADFGEQTLSVKQPIKTRHINQITFIQQFAIDRERWEGHELIHALTLRSLFMTSVLTKHGKS